ncbi:MAG: helix-turn-helix domain-containing protein [Magnetospirillum sp. WYHS-4]
MSSTASMGRAAATAARSFVSLLSDLAEILSGAVLLSDLSKKKIEPNVLYSTTEVAKFLGTSRIEVIREIHAGTLHAKKVGDNYRITGKSVITFVAG